MSFSLKTELLPHQQETVNFAVSKRYIGDFSEMGSGKSLSALALIVRVGKKAMVVCPPHLVNNWLNEIEKHTNLKGSPHFLRPSDDVDVYVTPYTQLTKCEAIFKIVFTVVADEAHYLKNLDAKRTMTFHHFFSPHPPEYFMYLTGTPIKNRIPEIYSMLILFGLGPNSPKILEHYRSFYTFCCRFTNVKQTNYGNKYEGMKNVEELRKFINPFVIRHGAEVLNLPELSETSIVVSYAENDKLDQAFQRFTDSGIGADITVKRDSAVATAPFTSQLVLEALDSGNGPVVVFSDHKKPLEIMGLELSGKRVATINGDTNMAKRQDYVDSLNRGQLDVLLCTIGAASSGLNMTGSCLIILNDPPWVSGDLQQLIKRIHRIGQTRPCRIVKVLGSKTVDKIYKALAGKERVINKVIKEQA